MIALQDIGRRFRVGEQDVQALQALTLEVAAGEYVSIMGPSGSGKSTLLNVIGLLDRPDAGSYRFNGEDTTGLPERELARLRREGIGFVFQSFHLIPRLSARENVELPLVLAGVPAARRRVPVDAVLDRLGLQERAAHRPEQLSGGQRQRVAIARAVVHRPRLLLADEPTGNLDRAAGDEVVDTLEALNAEGITVLVVTHDPEIGARAGRRLRLDDGRLVGDDRRRPG